MYFRPVPAGNQPEPAGNQPEPAGIRGKKRRFLRDPSGSVGGKHRPESCRVRLFHTLYPTLPYRLLTLTLPYPMNFYPNPTLPYRLLTLTLPYPIDFSP